MYRANPMTVASLPLKGYIPLASAVLMLAAMSPTSAHAAEWDFTLGAGVGVAPDYEGSDDYAAVPVLLARAAKDNGQLVELRGTALRANLVPSSVFSAGPIVNYRFERDDVDEDAVDDLDDVDDAIEVGGFVGLGYQGWLARVTLTQDVNDAHDGTLLSLLAGYRAQLAPQWSLTTIASSTWADDDYMDTYFGIDAGDAAASGLDEFEAEEGFKDVGLTLRLAWSSGANWGVTANASYKRLLGDAEDSPVVDDVGDENQLFGSLALTYSF
ncbi:MAG: MipA/OmpV family protein [Alphaproteobacteria bacterium]|nr:MipA/OmpV family protein [Alphaproteobacteria bacterium]